MKNFKKNITKIGLPLILISTISTISISSMLIDSKNDNKQNEEIVLQDSLIRSNGLYPNINDIVTDDSNTFISVNENGKDQIYGMGNNHDVYYFDEEQSNEYKQLLPMNITPEEWNDWDTIKIKDMSLVENSWENNLTALAVIVNDGEEDHLYLKGRVKPTSSNGSAIRPDWEEITYEGWEYSSIDKVATTHRTITTLLTNESGEQELWSYGYSSYGVLGLGRDETTGETITTTDDPSNSTEVFDFAQIDPTTYDGYEIIDVVGFEKQLAVVVEDETTGDQTILTAGDNSKGNVGIALNDDGFGGDYEYVIDTGAEGFDETNDDYSAVATLTEIDLDFDAYGIESPKVEYIGGTSNKEIALVVSDVIGEDYVFFWGEVESGFGGRGPNTNEPDPYKPELFYATYDSGAGLNTTYIYNGYDIVDFAVSEQNIYALVNNGGDNELYSTGVKSDGALGNGGINTASGWNKTWNKVSVNDDHEIRSIYTGYRHAFAVTYDGFNEHLYSWGRNSANLGFEQNANVRVPVEVYLNPDAADFEVTINWFMIWLIVTIILSFILAGLVLTWVLMHRKHSKMHSEFKYKQRQNIS